GFARAQTLVAGDLDVAGTVGADGGEGAVGDVVVCDDDVVGAEDIDAVAILAGAAAARADPLDTVVGDDGTVARRLPAMYENAAIGTVCDDVGCDPHPAGLDAVERIVGSTRDGRALDGARNAFER